ncbi:hypothetical protein BH11PAT2_BH11PAT2_05490 [soil metagenome]
MSRVCVMLGEGKSERAFFESLLVNKLGFTETQKNTIFLSKDEQVYWVFPLPGYGSTHSGGYKLYQNPLTFYKAQAMLRNSEWQIGKYPELHYVVLLDVDTCAEDQLNDRETKTREAFEIAAVTHSTFDINFSKIEIESWFLAGLTVDYPYLASSAKSSVLKYSTKDPDAIHDPKEVLDSLLLPEVAGSRQRIGRDMGEHINLSQAIDRSASLAYFISSLRGKNLID